MSKPEKRRYKLSKVIDEVRDKVGGSIEIETDDGQVFIIDPPPLWNDTAVDPNVGPNDTGKAVFGEERWEQFKKAGGSYVLLNRVLEKWGEDQASDLGKSSASADS